MRTNSPFIVTMICAYALGYAAHAQTVYDAGLDGLFSTNPDDPWGDGGWQPGIPIAVQPALYFNTYFGGLDFAASVPISSSGFELSHNTSTTSNSGYGGMATYASSGDRREYFYNYFEVHSPDTVFAGIPYCVRLWMSLADSSNYRTSSLKMVFSDGSGYATGDDSTVWESQPDVTFNTDDVTKNGWHLVEGSWSPQFTMVPFPGNRHHFVLGDFKTDAYIDTTWVGGGTRNMACYFIDDVSIVRCDMGVGVPAIQPRINVYPQPVLAGAQVTIECPEHTPPLAVIRVMDALGHVVKSMPAEPGSLKVVFGTEGLAPGVYSLHVGGFRSLALVVQ